MKPFKIKPVKQIINYKPITPSNIKKNIALTASGLVMSGLIAACAGVPSMRHDPSDKEEVIKETDNTKEQRLNQIMQHDVPLKP